MAKVELPDLPSNSSMSRENKEVQKPKARPVINKNSLVSTRKNLLERFVDAWFDVGEDDSILRNVVIPAVKNTILEALNMMFFHGNQGEGNYYYTSYENRYKGNSYNYRKSNKNVQRKDDRQDRVNPRNIVVKERIEAEKVVDELRDRIEEYREASVADLLELVGIPSNFVDNNWGWDDVRSIGLRKVGNGWLIAVDEPRYLGD